MDFGFARSYTGAHGELMRTPCCTLNYAAPEVLHQAISKSTAHSSSLKKKDYSSLYNTNGYDNSCDVSLSTDLFKVQVNKMYGHFSSQAWSLGTVLFTMLTGRIPFQSYALKKHDASDANFILNRIIAKDEFNLDSPLWPSHLNFSSEAKSVITGLLTVNPARRLTISQLMRHPWLSQSQSVEAPIMQSYHTSLCPCKDSCFYGTSCPNCVTSSSLPQHHTTVTSTSLSSSSGSAEDPLLKCSLNERKRTLKMKLKKKHTITSPRKHGKKSKVVDHFEVLNSEEVEDDESVPVLPIDNRLSVVYKKGPSATSYNSAYDSGIQSLTSHHQSCSTKSSKSSTGSRGSNGTTGFYNHPLDQSRNTESSLSLSSTSSRSSQPNAHSTNSSLQLQQHQLHLMSTQSAKLPLHAKETMFSSDMSYTSSAAFHPATPYSTNLAKSHHSDQPYRDSIIPENKVTAYLATLKEECDPITETPVIEHRREHCPPQCTPELHAHCGSVFGSNAFSCPNEPSQPSQAKRLKGSSNATDDSSTLVDVGLPNALTHFERSNHQRQQQTKPILDSDFNHQTSISNSNSLNLNATCSSNSSSTARVIGKRAAYELQHNCTTNTTLYLGTNSVKTRRQKRPRPPTIVLDD